MCRVPGYLYAPMRPRPGPYLQVEPPKIVPLKEVRADVRVVDLCASVTIRQKFKNEENDPLEAVYKFELAENAAVSDFVAEIDGKKVKGTIKEKEEAKNNYDDAIASGHGAYLMEQSECNPNLFTVNVGNLPPGKEVSICITYVVELVFEEGKLKWVLPSSKDTATSRSDVPPLQLKVHLDMTSNIQAIASPSHPISFEFGDEPNQATVQMTPDSGAPDKQSKDFVLLTKLAKPHQPCGRVQRDSQNRKVVMLSLFPKLDLADDEDVYTEMIFVVDRSGSMSGQRIAQVRDTMQLFLRSLGEGTMFNIVGFGTRTEFLFKTSVEYNDKNLEIATDHVKKMNANLGGTNILKPLQEIFAAKPIEGYPRQLFILTDGEVSNTKECIDFVRNHAETTRVFTFGVGNDASQDLVKGMAKAGEGFYEFVVPGQSMEEKVMRQLNRAMQPALANITVDWGNIKVAQSPYRLPPLFCGGRLVIYGFLQDDSTVTEGDVIIKAQTALKPYEGLVHVNFQEAKDSDMLHKLGAKSMIKDLEEGRSFMHDDKGQLIRSKGDPVKETVRLSIAYGILSKHTAFVAVEEREEATEGSMQVRKIGIEDKPGPTIPTAVPVVTPFPIPPPACGIGLPYPMPMPMPLPIPACSMPPPRHFNFASGPVAAPCTPSASYNYSSISMGPPPPPSPACAPPPAMPVCAPSSSSSSFACAAPLRPMAPSKSVAAPSPRSGSIAAPARERAKSPVACRAEDSASLSLQKQSAPAPSLARRSSIQAEAEAGSSSASAAVSPQMREVIMKQKANGSWAWADIHLTGIAEAKLLAAIPTSQLDGPVNDDVKLVWVTALLAAYLEINFADQKVNWDLVVKKAKKFIARQKKSIKTKAEIDWYALASQAISAK